MEYLISFRLRSVQYNRISVVNPHPVLICSVNLALELIKNLYWFDYH